MTICTIASNAAMLACPHVHMFTIGYSILFDSLGGSCAVHKSRNCRMNRA